jgi:hypothetical protein
MANRGEPSCSVCYFSKAGLCALSLDAPCPTFRAVRRGAMEVPKQAPLIAREPRPRPASAAAAA